MSAFLIYAIKSAVVLTLLFVPGIFLMFREKMLRFNRMTLLSILMLSLVLPLCNFPALSMDNMPAVRAIEQGLIQAGVPIASPPTPLPSERGDVERPFPWFYVVSLLYAIGVMTILFIRLREVLSMGRIIRRGSIWAKDEADGIRIFCHAENVAPFSWLRNIVISEADYKENGREIILHEKAHILYHHSLDILLLTLVEAVQWWNPFVYLLGIYLRDVHEYEADDYVLRQGISCHAYSELVIRKAVGANSYTFANNFNHSLTKKRINMMHKTKPKGSRRSRVLYVLPMIALALSAFATPEFQTATGLIERTVKPSASTFTLEGKVPKSLSVSHYLIYIWDYAEQGAMPKPADTVEVRNGRFEYSCNLDQPYSGMLQAIHKDGTAGKYFIEFLFVPGEECKIDVRGEGLNEFTLGGSKFYRDWEAFAQFYEKAKKKAIALNGAGDDEYFASIADYNRRHKGEEGSLMYQCMWLANSNMDFSIFDDIQGGRFKRYIQHRKIQYGKQTVIDIHIDSEDKLSCGINHAKPEPISPKDMMELLNKHKGEPTVINLTSEKALDGMEHIVREACRKDEHLRINYEVKPKGK
ncbi:MAG: hypothetical protein IJ148_01185 [Bacteroidaceae bacterium]|nr:hypothetical protein [Bacteroidaceae bacterium]MBQ9169426.1 hypothetical protein [Bacteroidaceae bacterium]